MEPLHASKKQIVTLRYYHTDCICTIFHTLWILCGSAGDSSFDSILCTQSRLAFRCFLLLPFDIRHPHQIHIYYSTISYLLHFICTLLLCCVRVLHASRANSGNVRQTWRKAHIMLEQRGVSRYLIHTRTLRFSVIHSHRIQSITALA